MLLQTLKTTLWRLHVYLVHVRIRKINQRAFSDTWYNTNTGHRSSTVMRRSRLKLPKPSESSSSATVHFLFKNLVNDIKMLIVWNLCSNPLARMVLPLTTATKIHMTGSVRSWIHFLELRDDSHAQKEIQLVAQEIKRIFIREFPIISNALKYEVK